MTTGLTLVAVGMVLLAQLTVASTYAPHILPGLVLLGVGMGMVFAPGMQGGSPAFAPRTPAWPPRR